MVKITSTAGRMPSPIATICVTIAFICICTAIFLPSDVLRPIMIGLAKLTSPLAAFLGVLSGFLIQVMMRTAQALESNGLTVSEIKDIANYLDKQQREWRNTVFWFLVTAFFVFSIGQHDQSSLFTIFGVNVTNELSATCIFLILISALRGYMVVQGISGLQQLRHRLIIQSAIRREQEDRAKAIASMGEIPPPPPKYPDFGKVVSWNA